MTELISKQASKWLSVIVVLLLLSMHIGYSAENSAEINLSKGNIGIDVWSGYTTLKMGNFNQIISLDKNEKMKDGIIIGVDMDYFLTPSIVIGPRVSYLKANESQSALDLGDDWGSRVWTHNMNLVSFLVGGGIVEPLNESMIMTTKVYLGYGQAKWIWASEEPYYDKEESTFKGTGFVADFSFSLDYILTQRMKIGGLLGYRLAKIDNIKLEGGEDFPVTLDFSGMNIGLKVGYLF